MALHWNTTQIDKTPYLFENRDGTTLIHDGEPVVNAALWNRHLELYLFSVSMQMYAVGIGSITDANVKQLFYRMSMLATSYTTSGGRVHISITPAWVLKSFVGLTTNVTTLTETQWRSRLHRNRRIDWYAEYDRQLEEIRTENVTRDTTSENGDTREATEQERRIVAAE